MPSTRTPDPRLDWWQQARFGLMVHYGLYSVLGRHEWVMNRERIPIPEYERLARRWKPAPGFAHEWCRLAKAAGMKYMVMTTKHHEGFCLWDTKMTTYNAVAMGPGRDLVREYVDACRKAGMRVGLYYSLMDWHHPDGMRCLRSEAARRRFAAFTHGCVRELLSNYGPIDILWYDCAYPLTSPEQWESQAMYDMARSLQPDILINDRSRLPGDFATGAEEQLQPADPAACRAWFPASRTTRDEALAGGPVRPWESIMTFNGSWGFQATPPEDWLSTRAVIGMLRQATAGQGNLMLNIGPHADGSVPAIAFERLAPVGRWLQKNAEAVYGRVDSADAFEWLATGAWTQKGNTAFYWCSRWPGRELSIGGLRAPVRRVELLARPGAPLPFEQSRDRLIIRGLPARCPDRQAGIAVLSLVFARKPRHELGMCAAREPWVSPFQ